NIRIPGRNQPEYNNEGKKHYVTYSEEITEENNIVKSKTRHYYVDYKEDNKASIHIKMDKIKEKEEEVYDSDNMNFGEYEEIEDDEITSEEIVEDTTNYKLEYTTLYNDSFEMQNKYD